MNAPDTAAISVERTTAPLATIPESCSYLRVSRPTLYRLRRDDPDFPRAVQFGRLVRFRLDELAEYVAKRQEG